MDYKNNSFDGDDQNYDIHHHAIMSAEETEVNTKRLIELDMETETKVREIVEKSQKALMECGSPTHIISGYKESRHFHAPSPHIIR